jgi:hypothetical protein
MGARKTRQDQQEGTTLPFDVTQEIDPSLADQRRRSTEATLTQVDFDDITVVLPQKPKPRP